MAASCIGSYLLVFFCCSRKILFILRAGFLINYSERGRISRVKFWRAKMKKIIPVLIILVIISVAPAEAKSNAEPVMPCSLVLEPVNNSETNEKGVALVYKVKLTPSFPRTSVSIHAIHLPKPSYYGEYDGYEGFSFIGNEISWRFKLYPTTEETGPTLAGRVDDITANLENAKIEVRLSNTKTEKLGPVVLSNSMNSCH